MERRPEGEINLGRYIFSMEVPSHILRNRSHGIRHEGLCTVRRGCTTLTLYQRLSHTPFHKFVTTGTVLQHHGAKQRYLYQNLSVSITPSHPVPSITLTTSN